MTNYTNDLFDLKDILKEQSIKLDALLKNDEDAKQERKMLQDGIEVIDKKLDIATEERVPKTENTTKWGKLIIVGLTDIIDGKYANIDYYAIRAQSYTAGREYSKKFPNQPKIYETGFYEGNATMLYNKIKEYFKDKATFNMNDIKLKQNIDYDAFSEELVSYCNSIKEEF